MMVTPLKDKNEIGQEPSLMVIFTPVEVSVIRRLLDSGRIRNSSIPNYMRELTQEDIKAIDRFKAIMPAYTNYPSNEAFI